MSDDSAFAIIENARRIWAIGSIHGEADKLAALHERLFSRLAPGDRLIYLGNYLGYGPAIIETVDEILSFRRKFLARPPFTQTPMTISSCAAVKKRCGNGFCSYSLPSIPSKS